MPSNALVCSAGSHDDSCVELASRRTEWSFGPEPSPPLQAASANAATTATSAMRRERRGAVSLIDTPS
jgi:hypothetical protein